MKLTSDQLARLSTDEQAKWLLEQRAQAEARNPSLFFRPHACKQCNRRYSNPECKNHRIGQHEFLKSDTYVTAALAGNQFGKTTVGSVSCFIQHVPPEMLPKHLLPYRHVSHDDPVVGWAVCPSTRVMNTVTKPALQQWAPRDLLHGNSFGKAWEQQNSVLRFKDGGRLHVFTYEMDPDKFVGAQVDYVWFDEPPPEAIFNEASVRVIRRKGKLKLTLTPVNMQGGGIGYLYRRIYKQREHPDITVVRGSIHDNPFLPEEEVERFLAAHKDDPDLAAREYGDFVHVGGMIFPGGLEQNLCPPPPPEHVRNLDIVVSIDPGLKNAAFIWTGFDKDNVALTFDEVLLQEKTPADYVKAIRQTNAKWGISKPLYVIDPSARNRSLVNALDVQAELSRLGIPCVPGQNRVEAGLQQIRLRLQNRHLLVSTDCRGLRDEAEEYRMQDRPDGEFKVVKENDHRMDAWRYGLMTHPFWPTSPIDPRNPLGFNPNTGRIGPWHPSMEPVDLPESSPLGNWS